MGYDCGSGVDKRQLEKTIKVKSSQEGREKKDMLKCALEKVPHTLVCCFWKAHIPQHEQHGEIKDTEMLFNHFSIVLLAFAFTPHPVNLHGLLLCCQLISHPPAPANQWAVAGR